MAEINAVGADIIKYYYSTHIFYFLSTASDMHASLKSQHFSFVFGINLKRLKFKSNLMGIVIVVILLSV